MNDLEKLRDQIDELDKNMADLYEKRMQLAKDIAEIKKLKDLPIFDKKRESDLVEKNLSLINDPELRNLYQQFLEFLLEQSKAVQEKHILENA